MKVTTTDMAALLAAIDAGDDGALPYLADLLEEQGDHRAARLRAVIRVGYRPLDPGNNRWTFVRPTAPRNFAREHAASVVLVADRLTGGRQSAESGSDWDRLYCPDYPTRSAAYLALGVALAGGAQ